MIFVVGGCFSPLIKAQGNTNTCTINSLMRNQVHNIFYFYNYRGIFTIVEVTNMIGVKKKVMKFVMSMVANANTY